MSNTALCKEIARSLRRMIKNIPTEDKYVDLGYHVRIYCLRAYIERYVWDIIDIAQRYTHTKPWYSRYDGEVCIEYALDVLTCALEICTTDYAAYLDRPGFSYTRPYYTNYHDWKEAKEQNWIGVYHAAV